MAKDTQDLSRTLSSHCAEHQCVHYSNGPYPSGDEPEKWLSHGDGCNSEMTLQHNPCPFAHRVGVKGFFLGFAFLP